MPVTLIMLEAVRDFREATGRQIGVKPAGGISTAKDAIKYLVMVNETAGEDWLTPDWFRFGASRLLNDLLMQRTKLDDRPLLRSRLLHPRLEGLRPRAEPDAHSSTPRPRSRARSSTSSRRTGCSSTASSSRARGHAFKSVSPATEEVLAEISEASEADVDTRGEGRAPRLHAHLVEDVGRRARQVPLPDRAHPPGARARARRARVARQRQADQGVARRRRPARRGVLLLLRRLGRQARARRLRPRPAAARRRRPGHPVELPAADARVEDRPGARVRQHGRAQAGRDDRP